jgi:hypothetical protein
VEAALVKGAARATALAEPTLAEAQRAVGLNI